MKPFKKTIWEELEHMRIAQKDILDYTLSADWESPSWPDDYWPASVKTLDDKSWNVTHDSFFNDLQRVKDLVNNPEIDLTMEIPWGEGRTYMRQVLLVADHNTYHLCKIVTMHIS